MQIEILLYEGCLGSEVFAFADALMMADMLAAAGQPDRARSFDVRFVSADGSPRSLAGGLGRISAHRPGACDLLLVPGTLFADREALVAAAKALTVEHELIRRHWAKGRKLATICVGAFVVAAAGVARGRRVATGWPVAELLPTIDRSITVVADELVATDGTLTTSGATTAAYDLALALVTQEIGPEVAHRLRKILLLEPNRPGQRAFGSTTTTSQLPLSAVHRAKAHLRDNMAEPFNLARLASLSGSSPRTLQRNFRQQTGMTPLSFLQSIRIDRAKQLLESTRMPVSAVAIEVGYVEEASFRNLFRKLAGIAPSAYRSRFSILRT